MVAFARHFGYSRSSGLAPGVSILMKSPFSDSIVFSVYTRKMYFCDILKEQCHEDFAVLGQFLTWRL